MPVYPIPPDLLLISMLFSGGLADGEGELERRNEAGSLTAESTEDREDTEDTEDTEMGGTQGAGRSGGSKTPLISPAHFRRSVTRKIWSGG